MNDIEDFDDIIRQKAGMPEFPFDESNWEKAAALIDSDRRKKKRKGMILLFSGLFILGSIAVTSIFLLKDKPLSAHKNTGMQIRETATVNTVDGGAPPLQNDSYKQPEPITNTASADKKPVADQNLSVPERTDNNPPESKKTPAATRPEKTVAANYSTVHSGPSVRTKKKKTHIPQVIETAVPTQDTNASNTVQQTAVQPVLPSAETTASTPADSLTSLVKDSTAKDSVVTVKADSIFEKEELPTYVPKQFIFLVAGANYALAWDNGGGFGNGFGPQAGISYSHTIGRHLEASGGLHYVLLHNSSNAPFAIRNTIYDFGKTEETTSIRVKNLQYLAIPVLFGFAPTDKNCFSLGCNISWMVNSSIEKETQKTTSLAERITRMEPYTGQIKGFHSFDAQAVVAYRRKIASRLSVQAGLFYGLTDVVTDRRLDKGAVQKNRGLTITFHYTILNY